MTSNDVILQSIYSPKYGSSSSQSSNRCIEKDDKMSDYNNDKKENKAAVSQGNSPVAIDTALLDKVYQNSFEKTVQCAP